MISEGAHRGGCRYLTVAGSSTTTLKWGVKLWVIDATGAGAVIRMPPATDFPVPGAGAFVVVIVEGSATVEIQDYLGNTLLDEAAAERVLKIDLSDNSSVAGQWHVENRLLGGGGPSPSYDYFVAIPALDDGNLASIPLYDFATNTWQTSFTATALNGWQRRSVWNTSDTLYIHGGPSNANSAGLRSYALSTLTTLTSSTSHNGFGGCAAPSGAGICYNQSGAQIQEYSPGSNSWSSLGTATVSSVAMPSQSSAGSSATGWSLSGNAYFMPGSQWNSPASANNFYQHTRSGDSWSVLAAAQSSVAAVGLWTHEDDDEVHRGSLTSSHLVAGTHRRYNVTAATWSTTTPYPTTLFECSGVADPVDNNVAMLWFNQSANGTEFGKDRRLWNNTTDAYSTPAGGGVGSEFDNARNTMALTIQ